MTEMDLKDFDGCDSLKVITYTGNVIKAKTTKGPANLTTLNMPNTAIVDLETITEIANNIPSLVNLDFSGASEFTGKLEVENLSVVISEDMYKKIGTTVNYVNTYGEIVYEKPNISDYKVEEIDSEGLRHKILEKEGNLQLHKLIEEQLNSFLQEKTGKDVAITEYIVTIRNEEYWYDGGLGVGAPQKFDEKIETDKWSEMCKARKYPYLYVMPLLSVYALKEVDNITYEIHMRFLGNLSDHRTETIMDNWSIVSAGDYGNYINTYTAQRNTAEFFTRFFGCDSITVNGNIHSAK